LPPQIGYNAKYEKINYFDDFSLQRSSPMLIEGGFWVYNVEDVSYIQNTHIPLKPCGNVER
jgi:hypothetical protein